jgi:cobalamin biosynthesis Mg chelatase CobN
MPNPTVSKQPSASGNYAPSVPISVYRELAAELQATKTMLESVNTQNQQLQQENQVLRQEMESLVQHAVKLQHVLHPGIAATPSPAQINATHLASQIRTGQFSDRPSTTANPSPAFSEAPHSDELSDELFTEQAEISQPKSDRHPPKDLSSFWMTLVVVVIVITAFGAGFLVVRPWLSNR